MSGRPSDATLELVLDEIKLRFAGEVQRDIALGVAPWKARQQAAYRQADYLDAHQWSADLIRLIDRRFAIEEAANVALEVANLDGAIRDLLEVGASRKLIRWIVRDSGTRQKTATRRLRRSTPRTLAVIGTQARAYHADRRAAWVQARAAEGWSEGRMLRAWPPELGNVPARKTIYNLLRRQIAR